MRLVLVVRSLAPRHEVLQVSFAHECLYGKTRAAVFRHLGHQSVTHVKVTLGHAFLTICAAVLVMVAIGQPDLVVEHVTLTAHGPALDVVGAAADVEYRGTIVLFRAVVDHFLCFNYNIVK